MGSPYVLIKAHRALPTDAIMRARARGTQKASNDRFGGADLALLQGWWRLCAKGSPHRRRLMRLGPTLSRQAASGTPQRNEPLIDPRQSRYAGGFLARGSGMQFRQLKRRELISRTGGARASL